MHQQHLALHMHAIKETIISLAKHALRLQRARKVLYTQNFAPVLQKMVSLILDTVSK